MSVTVRPYRGGPALEADVRYEHPDGTVERVRKRFKNGTSESQAERWGQRVLVEIGKGTWRNRRARTQQKKRVKTAAEFAPTFLDDYCVANGSAPSTILNKRGHLERHILEVMGTTPLDAISSADVERLLARIKYMTKESKNNHLATLDTLLQAAVEMHEIERMPCVIRMLRDRTERVPRFYGFDEYDQLISGATSVALDNLAAVGLGGDQGLRIGEVAAVRWSDISLFSPSPSVTVRSTAWKNGQDLTPKRGRERKIPLTTMMAYVLKKLNERARREVARSTAGQSLVDLDNVRLGDQYVFRGHKHGRVHTATIRAWFMNAQRAAGLPVTGNFHLLRHTFCSHLAARGVPAIAIKELAGHRSIRTTEKYMHNLPGTKERGIAALDAGRAGADSTANSHASPAVRKKATRKRK